MNFFEWGKVMAEIPCFWICRLRESLACGSWVALELYVALERCNVHENLLCSRYTQCQGSKKPSYKNDYTVFDIDPFSECVFGKLTDERASPSSS